MKVKDKIFVVTGGGSGIGRQLVLQLLAKGAAVAILEINPESLDETVALAGASDDRLAAFVGDVTDRERVMALPAQVAAQLGPVDGLINNAGIIQPFVPVADLDFDTVERVMNTDFYGPLNMIKAFLPGLLQQPEAHIVNISSMGGYFPFPGQSIYGAAKAAIKLLTEGLYAELMDTNVHVTVVFPGAVNTNIAKNSGVESFSTDSDGRMGKHALQPEKAAALILRGVEGNRFQIYVGSDAKVMNALYRLSPRRTIRAVNPIFKRMLEGRSG